MLFRSGGARDFAADGSGAVSAHVRSRAAHGRDALLYRHRDSAVRGTLQGGHGGVNLLAIGAHPDDIEFGCAPVLIKEIQKGNQVKLLVLSLGEAGTSGTPQIRERESRDAAAKMGAAIEFLDFGGDC